MIRLRKIERCHPLARGQFFYVLRDINLDIAEGEFVSIMGPSGAENPRCSISSECTTMAGPANSSSMKLRSII